MNIKRKPLIVSMGAKPTLPASKANAVPPLMQLRVNALAPNQYDLLIYGQIGENWWDEESVTARSVVDELNALPANINQINVRINSIGGNVHDALAIYNALKASPATIAVTVDGVAMSAASFIAMAGDTVSSPDTSIWMIHGPSTYAGGNAVAMRAVADALDTYAATMAPAYAAKSGKSVEDALALLTDGVDHYYTGTQAVTEGFADAVIDASALEPEPVPADACARFLAALEARLADAPQDIRQMAITASTRTPFHQPVSAAGNPGNSAAAASAKPGDIDMNKLRKLFAAGYRNKLGAEGGEGGGGLQQDTPTVADVHAALRTRNADIKAMIEPYLARDGVQAIYTAALEDPTATVDSVRAKVLDKIGAQAAPLGRQYVEMGLDTRDKLRAAGEQILLARAGVIKGEAADKARQGNPFARSTLVDMGEKLLIQAGVDTRDMSREDIARRVLSVGESTGDFGVLLENVLHKTLVGAYNTAAFTWSRFCATGTLSDYRPHNRYHLSSFSDLLPVGEGGEYKNGVLGDGEKETIQGKRKGRILEITPEVLVNDDLGAFVRLASTLGQAAGRTIEKDVYALLAQNNGMGPKMSDGKTLFHADHKNIATTPAYPSVASLDALRQQLALQKDPGGNDYLDLTLSIWLGPVALGGEVRVLNDAQYDINVEQKFQVPNRVRGLFTDIVDSPRLAGTAWYGFTSPSIEPVLEVAFLDGVQTPTLQQETNFRTDGLAWKVVGRYGVGAIGWRGAIRNAGAAAPTT